jgi:hypothetical protein
LGKEGVNDLDDLFLSASREFGDLFEALFEDGLRSAFTTGGVGFGGADQLGRRDVEDFGAAADEIEGRILGRTLVVGDVCAGGAECRGESLLRKSAFAADGGEPLSE